MASVHGALRTLAARSRVRSALAPRTWLGRTVRNFAARLPGGRGLALVEGDARGAAGERYACRQLARRGMRLLERRLPSSHGELDLVLLERDTLVVVEVKTGRAGPRFRPGTRVRRGDLARRAVSAARIARHVGARRSRVDVVEVLVKAPGSRPGLVHHRDAARFPKERRPPWWEELR